MRLLILLGTKKGAFLLQSDRHRRAWSLRGPFCNAWPINHVKADEITGTIYAAGGNEWFGPAVWKTTDQGETWTHSSDGLAYPEGQEPVRAGWSLAPAHGRLYAGVQPAGLFVSEDDGETWTHVHGLRDHPSCPQWQPGAGGLILHSIVPDPADEQRMWVAISAAGVFHTQDGGATWQPRNSGTRCDFLPEEQRYPEFGQCVHCLVMAPGRSDHLYQQNHCGMYRSVDGGATWQSIESGLPSTFGFPAAAHPRDPSTLFLFPLNGAETRALRTGRQCRGLAHARWGRNVAGAARRPTAGACVLRGIATGDERRWPGARRDLRRHQHRIAIRQRG